MIHVGRAAPPPGLPPGALAESFLRRQLQQDRLRAEARSLRARGIWDPPLERELDRQCAIGTPSASTNVTASNGSTKQSNALTNSAGDLLLGFFVYEDTTTVDHVDFSDLGSNTWAQLSIVNGAGGGPKCVWGYAIASGGTTNNKVTAAPKTAANAAVSVNFAQIVMVKVSGCDTSSPFDQQNTGTGTSNAPSAGSITTLFSDEIIFVGCKTFGAGNYTNGSWLGGSGTELFDNADTVGIGYRIVSATGSYTGNGAFSVSQQWAAAVCSFKAAAAASGKAFPWRRPGIRPALRVR